MWPSNHPRFPQINPPVLHSKLTAIPPACLSLDTTEASYDGR